MSKNSLNLSQQSGIRNHKNIARQVLMLETSIMSFVRWRSKLNPPYSFHLILQISLVFLRHCTKSLICFNFLFAQNLTMEAKREKKKTAKMIATVLTQAVKIGLDSAPFIFIFLCIFILVQVLCNGKTNWTSITPAQVIDEK